MTLNTASESDDFTRFQITSRREILSLLRTLKERNQLVSLLINGGSDTILTSILDIDDENNIGVIDSAPGNFLNERILASKKITFETVLDHIRIVFQVPHVEDCHYENRPALLFTLPSALVRLQRRDAYRVATPVVNPVRCTIQIPDETGTGTVTVTTSLHNISAGGVGLIDEKKMLDNTFGTQYADCRIDLPGGTPVVVTLAIRNSQDITLTNGKAIRRLGCEFIDLHRAMDAAIQRYITKLEREQNSKATGMR